MRDFLSELSSLVQEARAGATQDAISSWESRAGRSLPEELKRLYQRFNGGRFQGDVEVHGLESVASGEGAWVLGRQGANTQLLMLPKEVLAQQSGAPLPSWLESLPQDTWVFALKQGEGPLKPARTFEGILDRVLPPRETETFGETTFARGMSAVQEALASLPVLEEEGIQVIRAKPASARPKKKTPTRKPKPKAKAKAKRQKSKRATAKKVARTKKAGRKPAKKRKAHR